MPVQTHNEQPATDPEQLQQLSWGAQLADRIGDSYPFAAAGLRHAGITANCTNIDITNPQFTALFQHFENHLSYVAEEKDAHVQALQIDNAALRESLTEKSDLIARQAAAILQQTQLRPVVTPNRRLSADPDKFSGQEKDISKRQTEYVNWRWQIQRVFAVDKHVFPTDSVRIHHIAGLLTGDAADLHRRYFTTLLENPDDPDLWFWKTPADVFSTLNAQYETLDLSLKAGRKLDKLFMGGRPFQNFLAEFNTLADKCGKTEAQKVEALRVKVSAELYRAITGERKRPDKNNFQAWSSLYQELYDNLIDEKHIELLRGGSSAPKPPAHQNTNRIAIQPPVEPAGDPMQLDAARTPLDECAYCHEKGHWKADCPQKHEADATKTHRDIGTAPQRYPTTYRGGFRGFGGRGNSSLRGRGGMSYFGRGGAQNTNHSGATFGRGIPNCPLATQRNNQYTGAGHSGSFASQADSTPRHQRTYGPEKPLSRFRNAEFDYGGFVEGEVESMTGSDAPSPSVTDSHSTNMPENEHSGNA